MMLDAGSFKSSICGSVARNGRVCYSNRAPRTTIAEAATLDQENPSKWRHHEPAIILLGVRWYLRYSLSYRDLEEMMAERGLPVDHTTI
jgi:hypothetical protein